MIIVTSSTIPNKTIKSTFGIVRGNTIRARHIGKDIPVFRTFQKKHKNRLKY